MHLTWAALGSLFISASSPNDWEDINLFTSTNHGTFIKFSNSYKLDFSSLVSFMFFIGSNSLDNPADLLYSAKISSSLSPEMSSFENFKDNLLWACMLMICETLLLSIFAFWICKSFSFLILSVTYFWSWDSLSLFLIYSHFGSKTVCFHFTKFLRLWFLPFQSSILGFLILMETIPSTIM